MNKILFFFLLTFNLIPAQSLNLKSPENIKLFADFLFCGKDYLRAVEEYENYLAAISNDTIRFKIAFSYQKMDKLLIAENKFKDLYGSSLSHQSKIEFFKTIFLSNNFKLLRREYKNEPLLAEIKKLYLLSYFFTDDNFPEIESYTGTFSSDKILNFYEWKINPPYKSPLSAALMSAVIPGLGKIYTDKIGDGITAFLASGVLAYLSYSNFKHHHDFRGWLFGGLGALFYAGNIYGSAAAAKIYNAKIRFDFESEVKVYVEQNNYFAPYYNFCE